MKKIVAVFLAGVLMLASSTMVFAENAVSDMATQKGGQAVAECAKNMGKGVSECSQLPECIE
ncbi:MAG: hypothetical protein K0R84_283 [Clostridia bacterium]|jgi:hypothetical protein|nr:hypothetical protein [Clostridia bacterium]